MPRPQARRAPSFALEFASSFVVCCALATLDVQATLARKYLRPILDRVGARALADDDAAVTLALLFVNLAIVFSPSYQALTRGAANNPTVYALKGMLGETRAGRACANACAAVLAHVCALKAVMVVMRTHPEYLPGKGAIAPIVPAGRDGGGGGGGDGRGRGEFLVLRFGRTRVRRGADPDARERVLRDDDDDRRVQVLVRVHEPVDGDRQSRVGGRLEIARSL